ncbi:MAG: aldehyde dehydrogenase family protein, partial [Chloroflexota bacterium]|nr:aldehyde dehydrogenase family protein [Chloroflexota bacterium]
MALKTLPTERALNADRALIDGKLVSAADGRIRTLINPATGAAGDTAPECGAEDVNRAVAAAKRAFEDGRWTGLGPGGRAAALFKLADLLEQHVDALAAMESRNVGKPIK